jgi:hypothetical protein
MRVAIAVLAGVADLGIQQLSPSRIEPREIVLFLIVSVLAGLVIARWWATTVAVTCLLLTASGPAGGEDAGGAVQVLVGVEFGIAQALLIGLGVVVTKLVATGRATARPNAHKVMRFDEWRSSTPGSGSAGSRLPARVGSLPSLSYEHRTGGRVRRVRMNVTVPAGEVNLAVVRVVSTSVPS